MYIEYIWPSVFGLVWLGDVHMKGHAEFGLPSRQGPALLSNASAGSMGEKSERCESGGARGPLDRSITEACYHARLDVSYF